MVEIHKIDIKLHIIEIKISDELKNAIENSEIPISDLPEASGRSEYSVHDLQAWLQSTNENGKQSLTDDAKSECMELIERLFSLGEENFYIKQQNEVEK